jgi:hypothetical protein
MRYRFPSCIFLLISACFLVIGKQLSARTTLLDPSMTHKRITELLNGALPGDTLLFTKGIYGGAYALDGLHGKPEKPIVIRGMSIDLSIIDGGVKPGMLLEHQAFRLTNCSWIVIEELSIRNCWTDLIRAENSSYISLRNCDLQGGKRALFATGRRSHHFLIETCSWEQDERVWSQPGDYSWEEIHHGKHQHYNGSLFQGSEISGVFVLRDNIIRNTFNAFRLSQINQGAFDPLACTNGEIYRNSIINTSDNVLEPEVHTRNLHFYHNTMINGHAFVSITEVQGGEIYIYGNTAVSLPSSEDGWTIFKISCREDSLSLPLYIYNNSWQVDFDIIGSPRHLWENSHIRHFNNACFSEVSDSFGIYNLGDDNRFDYDCSNVPFPSLLTSAGLEKHGLVADPLFMDPYGGDFRLKSGSPCIKRGRNDPELILDPGGRRPDIGAYNRGELIEGIPFRYVHPEVSVPYRELPRITRMKMEGRKLKLWFSLPMDAFTLKAIRKVLVYGERHYPVSYSKLSGDGYCLTLKGESLPDPDPGDPHDMKLLLSEWPMDVQGQKLSYWASYIPVSLFSGSK